MADYQLDSTELKTACGGVLKEPEGYPSAIYYNQKVYFCTAACLRVFKRDPDAFMSGKVEHPTGEE